MWVQMGAQLQPDPSAFFSSIVLSADGRTVAAAAGGRSYQGEYQEGFVVIFQFNDDFLSWNSIGRITSSTPSVYSNLIAVALSENGTIVAVQDPSYSDPGRQVRVFENIQGEWIRLGQAFEVDQAFFGGVSLSLSADGGIVAIGSIASEMVHVFRFETRREEWMPFGAPITTTSSEGYETFGSKLELSADGSMLAIGDGIGNLFIYLFSGLEWQQIEGTSVNAFSFVSRNSATRVAIVTGLDYQPNRLLRTFDYKGSGTISFPSADRLPDTWPNEEDASLKLKGWEVGEHSGLELEFESSFYFNFDRMVEEWDNGTPDGVTLTTKFVPESDPRCLPVFGKVKVCENDYGQTSWREINLNLVDTNGFLKAVVIKLNAFYLNSATASEREYTVCHAIGHALGLNHVDDNYFNRDLGSCMDYTTNPEANTKPSERDFASLVDMYGRVSDSGSRRRRALAEADHLLMERFTALVDDFELGQSAPVLASYKWKGMSSSSTRQDESDAEVQIHMLKV